VKVITATSVRSDSIKGAFWLWRDHRKDVGRFYWVFRSIPDGCGGTFGSIVAYSKVPSRLRRKAIRGLAGVAFKYLADARAAATELAILEA
jgi:hypothetical protein